MTNQELKEVQEIIYEARQESEAFDLWYESIIHKSNFIWGLILLDGSKKLKTNIKDLSDTILCLEGDEE